MKVTLLDNPMPMWPPNTRLYVTEVGWHYAVHADSNGLTVAAENAIDTALAGLDQLSVRSGVHTIKICETTIVACNDDGIAADLTPAWTFPAGTTHEDALIQAGFEL